MTLEKNIFGGFGLALAILAVAAVASYHSVSESLEDNRSVAHTQEVLKELETTLFLIKEAESGHRGYVITGDEQFLITYAAAIEDLPRQVKQVRVLTSDDPAQQHRLDILEPLLRTVLQFRAATITLQKTIGAEAAREKIRTKTGKQLGDDIQTLLAEMMNEERHLLTLRTVRSESRARTTIAVLTGGSLLALLIVIVASMIVRRELALRRRAEEERQRFFTLSQDMLCTAGFDGYFKNLSPSWEKTLGYTKEELLAKPYLEFIHPEDRAKTSAEARKISEGHITVAFENRYRCKDGSYRWFLWSATPVREDQLTYAAARDITDSKQAQEALRESEERLRLMVTGVTDYAILMLDTDGRIVSWNVGAQRLKGYQANEVIGRHFSHFYPPEDIQSGKPEHELKMAATEGRFEDEGWRVRKDGTRFWANVVITAVQDEAGTLRGFAKVTRDLTERKRTEDRIKNYNAQLEAANKELEAFSYSVSHDLRAPLRHIDGFSDLLQKHAASALDEKGRRYLKTISGSAKQMGALVDDLLTFSRMGRAELRFTTVNLDQLVKDVLNNLHQDTEGRNITWTVGALPVVHGDHAMLRQVLLNLIDNAVKYTRTREHACIEIGCNGTAPGEPVIFVRDNGAGFDMQYAHKLFGVFQRLHSATDFEGTGIGLANVRRIITRHGGRTWADGTVDGGATFYFSLPARKEASHDD